MCSVCFPTHLLRVPLGMLACLLILALGGFLRDSKECWGFYNIWEFSGKLGLSDLLCACGSIHVVHCCHTPLPCPEIARCRAFAD